MSASAHLASWCCTTVLPLPNGPGTAATPPFAMGNIASMTRWPVTRGISGGSLPACGLPARTGHFCMSVSFVSPPFSL